MNICKLALVAVLLMLGSWAGGDKAVAQVSLDLHLGQPGPTYVWLDGYWSSGPRRRWVRPHWEDPPYERARWHGGRWYRHDESWEDHGGPGRGRHHGDFEHRGHGRGKWDDHGKGHGHGHDRH